jgi:hypothetical protein
MPINGTWKIGFKGGGEGFLNMAPFMHGEFKSGRIS